MHPIASLSDLADIVRREPDHVPPRPGNIVDLSYPALDPLPEVRLATDPWGNAKMLVLAEKAEAARLVDAARNAVAKSAERTQGRALEASEVEGMANGLARKSLFAQAVLRTGVFPFLEPRYAEPDAPVPDAKCGFVAVFTLRPQSELSDYQPVDVAVPAEHAVDEAQIDDRIDRLMGGTVRWQDVPEDAQGSLDRLRERARRSVEAEEAAKRGAQFMQDCTDALARRLNRDAPTRYVELLRDEFAARYAGAVEQGGQSWSDYVATPGFSLEAFKEEMTEEARRSLRRGLALDAAARHFSVRLTEEDLFDCLAETARGHELDAARAMYDNGTVASFVERATRAKTADLIARQAYEG